jgi:hypothetical protein
MRPLFPSPTRISHLALCDQANARIAGCVRRNPGEATQEGKTFVSAMTGSTNPHSREVDQIHSRDRHGGLCPPNPRSFPHWANGQTPQRLNASTPQRLNASTPQRLNASTPQRLNKSCRAASKADGTTRRQRPLWHRPPLRLPSGRAVSCGRYGTITHIKPHRQFFNPLSTRKSSRTKPVG